MKITILGGGPAGLYCALLLKKANPAHEITLLERNAPDATYGWGVVFSDRTLASFREADHKTYTAITDHFVTWDAIDTYVGGELVRCGGHVFAGLARKQLLAILQQRCRELGVTLRFNTDITDLAQFGLPTISPHSTNGPAHEVVGASGGRPFRSGGRPRDSAGAERASTVAPPAAPAAVPPAGGTDLLIAADGVNSLIRAAFTDTFKPSLVPGKARYIWLGTNKVLDAFTFIFRENEHGFFQVHAYPFDGTTSTFIVECAEESWRRAGLDTASEAESIAYCERLFAEELRGARLLPNNSKWISFVTVRNATWRHGNVVLLGDSAHTAHFSIGSGTKLAMEDAIALANTIEQHADLATALREYEAERRPIVETLQEAARESQRYFEGVSRYRALAPIAFTFNLLTRSGRVTYDDLRLRDIRFGEAVDQWFTTSAGIYNSGPHWAGTNFNRFPSPPALTPFRMRNFFIRNCAVLTPESAPKQLDGGPEYQFISDHVNAALAGPGLILTRPVATSTEGRITPENAGLYTDEQAREWTLLVSKMRNNSARDSRLAEETTANDAESQPAQAGFAADRPSRRGFNRQPPASAHDTSESQPVQEPRAKFARSTEPGASGNLVTRLHLPPITALGIILNHAGRRGATRPRREGLDRPLRENAWPLVSASPIPYTPRSQTPAALDRAGMERVRDDFARAAQLAHTAGFDLLMLHMAHGYLLASFLSPLANVRDDEYGGALENRLRFPLEVLDAVRAVWPAEKPLAVALTCDDWAPGGITIDEAVEIARTLKVHGCDLIQVLAGQTVPDPVSPTYGRGFLMPLSDRIRNEAGIPTLVGGYLPTTNDVNTILAAGRADLCLVDFPHRAPRAST